MTPPSDRPRNHVLYHGPTCNDGFCAAWIAGRFFDEIHETAQYTPVQYDQDPPDTHGQDVYLLDFSYPRAVCQEIHRHAESLTIIDHHKTSREDLKGLADPVAGLHVTFDMQKSGARLAWEHFNGETPTPWVVDYVEDRDLWLWRLPESRAVNACLQSADMTFAFWDWLAGRDLKDVTAEGKAILRYQGRLVLAASSQRREIKLAGHKTLAVNAIGLQSEICENLLIDPTVAIGACWYVTPERHIVWSLRSRDDGPDVGEVAKLFGGGGHVHSAGFRDVLDREGLGQLARDEWIAAPGETLTSGVDFLAWDYLGEKHREANRRSADAIKQRVLGGVPG